MWDKLKGVGAIFFVIAGFLIVALIAGLVMKGALWVSEAIFPWLQIVNAIAFALVLFLFLPMALFRTTRATSASAMLLSSYVFGATLWVWALLLTYVLWGVIAVFVGLFVAGIGVVPIAMLATGFKGMWSTFGELVLLTVLTLGARFGSIWIAAKVDEAATQ